MNLVWFNFRPCFFKNRYGLFKVCQSPAENEIRSNVQKTYMKPFYAIEIGNRYRLLKTTWNGLGLLATQNFVDVPVNFLACVVLFSVLPRVFVTCIRSYLLLKCTSKHYGRFVNPRTRIFIFFP